MAKIYYDKDANLSLLKRKTIGIIGFGSQGHAHAQNLRDGGCQVVVAELPGTQAWKAAKKAGFEVATAGVN
jgi:ketol-acid reductoisomerase